MALIVGAARCTVLSFATMRWKVLAKTNYRHCALSVIAARKLSDMPTRKLPEINWQKPYVDPNPCQDPGHDPPKMRVFEPGSYEHECPRCKNIQFFFVPKVTYG